MFVSTLNRTIKIVVLVLFLADKNTSQLRMYILIECILESIVG